MFFIEIFSFSFLGFSRGFLRLNFSNFVASSLVSFLIFVPLLVTDTICCQKNVCCQMERPHAISGQGKLPAHSLYFTLLHFTSLHFTSLHVTSRHVTSRHVTSRHVTIRHLTSPHLTSSSLHFTSSHFILLHFTSLHFTLLNSLHSKITIKYETLNIMDIATGAGNRSMS